MLNTYCMDCLENAVKRGCATPCIGYQHEPNHHFRMVNECAWLKSFVQDLFVVLLPLVRAEIIKRGNQ